MMIRFFDIIFSLISILILLPLFVLTSFILKVTGEGEIFYKQERVGKGGRNFLLYKFATMKKNSSEIGTGTITIKNDPRVLPIGKILRKTKINELPQLLNIIKGDMSLIGPRPLTHETFSFYDKDAQNIIKSVKPGLSGIGSIAFSNEENILKSEVTSREFYEKIVSKYKAQLEIWFIDNQSTFKYFSLILLTVIVLLLKNNKLLWFAFKSLPKPPPELENQMYNQ
tara:strand:+ start:41 stop:718 length:678 start_codon:yes stop_codon:yes gene_type:complete